MAAAHGTVKHITEGVKFAYGIWVLVAGVVTVFLPLYASIALTWLLPFGQLRDLGTGWLVVVLAIIGFLWLILSEVPVLIARTLLVTVIHTNSRRAHHAVGNIVSYIIAASLLWILFESFLAAAFAAALTTAGYLAAAPLINKKYEASGGKVVDESWMKD